MIKKIKLEIPSVSWARATVALTEVVQKFTGDATIKLWDEDHVVLEVVKEKNNAKKKS